MSTTLNDAFPAGAGLRGRFLAWWHGNEKPGVAAELSEKVPAKESEASPAPVASAEPVSRTEAQSAVSQLVWGDGFIAAGDAAYACSLVAPLDLTERKSLTVLGAALGGPMRAIVRKYGCWAVGYEQDPPMATMGRALSIRENLQRQAQLWHGNLETLELPERKSDCVFSKETLFAVLGKDRLLREAYVTLRPGGHLLFTDYMLGESGRTVTLSPRTMSGHTWETEPWRPQQYRHVLRDIGYEVQGVHDISKQFAGMIQANWANWQELVPELRRQGEAAAPMLERLVDEAGFWTARAAAIRAGDVKVVRFHALKRSRSRLLADW